MSKLNLTYEDIPETLHEEIVKLLREMESEQSNAWKDIFFKMSFLQKKQYSKLKGKQQRSEAQQLRGSWSFEEWCAHEFTMNNFIAARNPTLLEEEQITGKVLKRLSTGKEQFYFFWETNSPFSQWHKSNFSGPVYLWENDFEKQLIKQGYPPTREFTSAEQFMMYQKAMLFIDLEIAEKVINTHNARKIKELGRQVKRFNNDTWTIFRWQIVYAANKLKFTQNDDLKAALAATKGKTIVEASPYDKIWGIGLKEDDPKAQERATWNGSNLLGEILTELRIELFGSY